MNLTTILYHAYGKYPCPDGYAAAWVVSKVYLNAELIGCSYPPRNEPFKGMPDLNNKNVVIVDFSVYPEVFSRWKNQGCDITIIDHHQRALKHLAFIESQAKGTLDSSKCGAVLTWQYFFPDTKIPDFLLLIQERDCGDVWSLEQNEYWESEASLFHQYCKERNRTFELYDYLETKNKSQIVEEAKAIALPVIKNRRDRCDKLLEEFELINFEGYTTGYIELEQKDFSLVSDLGKMWLDTNDGMNRDGSNPEKYLSEVALMKAGNKYELRSNAFVGEVDVSEIAIKYGGGGHKHSAGFPESELSKNVLY